MKICKEGFRSIYKDLLKTTVSFNESIMGNCSEINQPELCIYNSEITEHPYEACFSPRFAWSRDP